MRRRRRHTLKWLQREVVSCVGEKMHRSEPPVTALLFEAADPQRDLRKPMTNRQQRGAVSQGRVSSAH